MSFIKLLLIYFEMCCERARQLFSLPVLSLTGEVDWLLQVHHGDVSLFRLSVVMSVDDDAIDSSGLNVHRVFITLSMKTKNSQPRVEVDVLPVEQKYDSFSLRIKRSVY